MDDPKLTPQDKKFVGVVNCVVFNSMSGELTWEDVWIPRGVKIDSYTMQEFYTMVMLKLDDIIHAKEGTFAPGILGGYKALEFYK